MNYLAFLHAHSDLFRKGIPGQKKHLPIDTINALAESIVEYNEYLKHFKRGHLPYPAQFRSFIIRLNRFIASHFTTRVNRVWQQVVQNSNRQPVNSRTNNQLLYKKHAARLACLEFLLACLVDNYAAAQQRRPPITPKKAGPTSRSRETYRKNQLPYFVTAHPMNGSTLQLVHFIIAIPQHR